MPSRTKNDPLPKGGRIDLKTTISPREYAEVKMYQHLEGSKCPTMIDLTNKLLRNYIVKRREEYRKLGMLDAMLNRLK